MKVYDFQIVSVTLNALRHHQSQSTFNLSCWDIFDWASRADSNSQQHEGRLSVKKIKACLVRKRFSFFLVNFSFSSSVQDTELRQRSQFCSLTWCTTKGLHPVKQKPLKFGPLHSRYWQRLTGEPLASHSGFSSLHLLA